MDKRFWISGIVVSLAAFLLGFAIHGNLLNPDYRALTGIYRTEADMQQQFHWMIVAYLLIGFAMTWIYRQGADTGRGALGQGLRFGLAMALFATIPGYLIYLTVMQVPPGLVHKQILFDTIGMLLLGVLVAYLNPRPARA